MDAKYWVGGDLGGTKLLVGLFDDSLKLVGVVKAKTPAVSQGDGIKDLIIQLIKQVLSENLPEGEQLAGICVAVPGPLDLKDGLVLDTPNIEIGRAHV